MGNATCTRDWSESQFARRSCSSNGNKPCDGHWCTLQVAPVVLDAQPGNASCWGAQLSQPLQPGATSELDVYAVFTKLQRPFPAHLQQAEPQRMLYQDSAHVLSPYNVATQSTKVGAGTLRILWYFARAQLGVVHYMLIQIL